MAGSRTMTEDERRKAVDKQLTRKGLVLGEDDVLEAMEHVEGDYRFLPLRLRSSGTTGEALVTAERLGKLERHTRRILGEVAAELAAGNIAADPFWRGPQQNACQWCDYAAACQFREGQGGDRKRWLPKMDAEEFWEGME